MNNEKRGIYNVTFNDKRATSVKTDLEIIEDAIIAEVIMYVKGYHDKRRDKGLGAEHIKFKHLDNPTKNGYITVMELLNLGNSLREYLTNFNKPFIDENGARIYEWENGDKVRFRLVVDNPKSSMSSCDNCTATHTLTNQGTNATSIAGIIITFYSDRNLNETMLFKNPKVQRFYEKQDLAPRADESQKSSARDAESKPKIRKRR